MKRGYAKIYFLVLFFLLIITFFYDFNQANRITGREIASAEEEYRLCGEKIFSADSNQEINGIALVSVYRGAVQMKIIFDPDYENNPFVIGDEYFSFNYTLRNFTKKVLVGVFDHTYYGYGI